MSSLKTQQNLKNDLSILYDQPDGVVVDFCKLAINFLTKGYNNRHCQTAAQKLGVALSKVQSALEGLLFIFVEAYQNELNEDSFRKCVSNYFKAESIEILCNEYSISKSIIGAALPHASVTYPRYSNLEWRFETQMTTKSVKNEILPRILMRLDLEKNGSSESLCIESDIPNIIHMSKILNEALQECKSNHSRRIQRVIL